MRWQRKYPILFYALYLSIRITLITFTIFLCRLVACNVKSFEKQRALRTDVKAKNIETDFLINQMPSI